MTATALRAAELIFVKCHGIASERAVVSFVKCAAEQRLYPGEGHWGTTSRPQVVQDIEAFIVERRRHSDQSLIGTTAAACDTQWSFALVNEDFPEVSASMTIELPAANCATVRATVALNSSFTSDVSVEVAAEIWGASLARLGTVLYERAKPLLGAVIWTDLEDETTWLDVPGTVAGDELVVGWRTWFGSQYVERFGADLLMGLPDRTERRSDGGIFHELRCSAIEMARGESRCYAAVGSFLARHGVVGALPCE